MSLTSNYVMGRAEEVIIRFPSGQEIHFSNANVDITLNDATHEFTLAGGERRRIPMGESTTDIAIEVDVSQEEFVEKSEILDRQLRFIRGD